ncbi:hypothetical protein [Streptomyces sp. NPDC047046]|uniref:hypothetical protein n=1 Tax=Streptomyces sp. NPDC047046 TaxID=3155378 RepID=UPI0033D24F32
MIPLPQLSSDGAYVRLPLRAQVEGVLDDLALAYEADPEAVGALLALHGRRVRDLDRLAHSATAPEYVRAVAAAEADASRDAVADEVPLAADLDRLLDPDTAITYAGHITRVAAHIRHRTNRSPRA